MPYNVTSTDKTKIITVYDNTSDTSSTSLTFPGRNVTGYGQTIAENFLHLLENFAAGTEPVNPTVGQVWYDTVNAQLKLYDGDWKAASGIQKGPSEPSVETAKVGELWIDTTNQQLRIFTGARWILVGPAESSVDGLRYGPAVEAISDSDNVTRNILVFYIADVPIIIVSKDSFTPKVNIPGFSPTAINPVPIHSGINIHIPDATTQDKFQGGYIPKLFGTAKNADALNVGGTEVAAGKFLRSDISNTTDYGIIIRSNEGLTLGVNSDFRISNDNTSASIYNSKSGSSLDLQTNKDGIPNTVLRVKGTSVGVNVLAPEEALDIDGNLQITGSVIINNTTQSTNLSNGSLRTLGGISVTKNVLIGTDLTVSGTSQLGGVVPSATETFDLGSTSKRWKTVRAKTIVADEIQGILNGNISGNANTATSLRTATTFKLEGDVISPSISFDGQVGGSTKIFVTSLTSNIISSKDFPNPNYSNAEDLVLTYRPSLAGQGGASGLLKQTRNTFIGDLGVPIGTMFPYAGQLPPYGYLFCDGSEVERVKYPDLYDIIGTTYNGSTALVGVGTFRLPDMRGRFALGRDNMDNAQSVPNSLGGFTDAGGGTAGRVPDIKAQSIGGSAGQSSVTLDLSNLPDHEHSMLVNGIQYSAVRVDTAINSPATTGLGPNVPGGAQYLNTTGGIKKPTVDYTLKQAVGIMNPYLTVNYIIRSGPPAFTTTTT